MVVLYRHQRQIIFILDTSSCMNELYQQCSTSKKGLHTVVKSVELVVADVVSADVVDDVVSVLVVVPCWYRVKKVHTFRYVISERSASQLHIMQISFDKGVHTYRCCSS